MDVNEGEGLSNCTIRDDQAVITFACVFMQMKIFPKLNEQTVHSQL